MSPRKSKGRFPKTRKTLIWTGIVVLIGCAATIWIVTRYHQRPQSASSIEDWVRQQDFDPVRPFRSDFEPGTLLSVGKLRDRVAMTSASFLEGQTGVVSQASLPNVTLTLKLNAKAEAGGTGAEVGGGEDLNASMELSNLQVLTLPLEKVKDGVQKSSRVEEALTDHPDDLFVILEALRVGKMRLSFHDESEAKAKAKSATDWVKATFGTSAGLDQSGTIQLDAPLILGTRVARLKEASTALGGASRQTLVEKVSTPDLEKFRNDVAPKVSRLYSNFDVYGLVIAMGNYPFLSKRAGGELPDAVRTGEWVAADLRRMVPPTQANHIQVITSNEVSPKTFDPTRRLSKGDLESGIHDFLQYVKKNSDPNKLTLVIFYYFGHGLGDGMSKSVFLVPEQFVDDESRRVSDISDRLIDISDINRQISEVTDHSIFLIDACRAYKDQAKELIEAWKKTVQQGSDIEGILNAIQFSSGIYGPTPIIFASADGMAADTVKYPAAGLSSGTGPLALKLRSVLEVVDSSDTGLPLDGFLHQFQSDTVSLPNLDVQEAVKLRGYTFFKPRFAADFGSSLIISADPLVVLPRKQAFVNPYADFASHAGGTDPPEPTPSGLDRAESLGQPSTKNVEELVFAPGVGLAARDEANDVWIRRGNKWRLIQKEFPIVHIGWDRRAGLLLYQWDEHILYGFQNAQLKPIYRGFHTELLGHSATEGFVVVRVADPDIYEVSDARDGKIRPIARVSAREVFDAAEDNLGRFWFTTSTGLWLYDGSRIRKTDASLWRPYTLAVMGEVVFVWSEDGRILYRLNTDSGSAEALDLRDIGFGDAYVRREGALGLAMEDLSTAYFGFGPEVLRLSLAGARWRKIEDLRS
jgi:hypothetical protein